jgi:hypothetical protein
MAGEVWMRGGERRGEMLVQLDDGDCYGWYAGEGGRVL